VSATFLEEMAAASLARVRAARELVSEAVLAERARRCPPPPPLRLAAGGFGVIAELKLRSPAAGRLGRPAARIAERVRAYARAGAAAVSVLTEPDRFDGSLEHLVEAQAALAPLGVPVMRKDFLVDPYQVLEARVAGAGGVLVILRLLPRAATGALVDCASSCGLFVLLEAFDADDLELMHELVAAHAGSNALLAGVNCRDLATLEVVPQRLVELAPLLPPGVLHVAESGVATDADARRVAAAGYDLALIGSALMREGDPTALLRSLLAAGRATHGVR
jgi:indole-3-glycerol phosphate synthase